MIKIKQTKPKDFETLLNVELEAFKDDPEINTLIHGIFRDPTAEPMISLLAYDRKKPVGHILFTKARLKSDSDDGSLKPGGYILAPLAVIPEYQNRGIGGMLIMEGLRILKKMGVERCFVLGHKTYYPKHGFIPDACAAGWPAPYPIPDENKDAWMWLDLCEHANTEKGRIVCADSMMKKEYWIE